MKTKCFKSAILALTSLFVFSCSSDDSYAGDLSFDFIQTEE
ncbi:hypothetical protein [Xanthomarina sp.]|nr:hypothetical protein [Xanthomarina sp.]HLV40313.1 hypothetical protein [Xanthomarina sp.]